MTPRRKQPDDDLESFDPEFDDAVFSAREASGDADAEAEVRAPRRKRTARRALSRTTGAQKGTVPRGRRFLRIAGVLALVGVLVTFVLSFIAGLGGAGERVTGDAESGGAALDRIGPRVRVEVLNAGGVTGLASRATDHLRDRGFDVVAFGNAGTSEFGRTVVLARTPDVSDAREVAAALGVDSVAVEPDPQLFLDVTVMLGRDWPPAADAAPEETGFFGWFRSLFD